MIVSEPSSPYFFAWNITHRTKHLGHDLNVLFKYCTQNLNGLRDIQSEVKTCGTWKKNITALLTNRPTDFNYWVMRVSILSWMPEQKQIKKNKISRYRIRKKLSQQLISCRTDFFCVFIMSMFVLLMTNIWNFVSNMKVERYNRRGKWSFKNLVRIPRQFEYRSDKSRFGIQNQIRFFWKWLTFSCYFCFMFSGVKIRVQFRLKPAQILVSSSIFNHRQLKFIV